MGEPSVDRLQERRVVEHVRPAALRASAKNGALAGLARTAGSAIAAWNAGSVRAADVNAVEILSGSVENRIEKKTAVPTVPPIWRKNVDDGGDHAHVPRGRGVLHGEHQRLHAAAEAEAEHGHVEVELPERDVDVDPEVQDHQRAGHQQRADDREHLVAAGARGQLAGRTEAVMMPATSGSISKPRLDRRRPSHDLQELRQHGDPAEHRHADDHADRA